NADARQTLGTLLEHEGHRVEEAADGASGLVRAEATRPDIVLIDIGLPGSDGYEVARRIRSQRGTAPILVAISGYGQADDGRRSRAPGFDAPLTKPVSADHLSDVLAALHRSRHTRAAPESGCARPEGTGEGHHGPQGKRATGKP